LETGRKRERVLALYDRLARAAGGHKRGVSAWLEERDMGFVLALLRPAPGLTALDVGCGLGVHARMLQRAGMRVCAVDAVPRLVEHVRPDVDEACVADLHHLDLGRRFDRVLCFGVLDFVRDPDRCLANLAMHVAAGGLLVIEVPSRSLAGLTFRLWYRAARRIHINLFDWRELDAAAARHGLLLSGMAQPAPHSRLMAWKRI
jgi:2-polyprenyl-3-methyl-5-hydroxy-6-metoxy-1,4-benzoquinol methylase